MQMRRLGHEADFTFQVQGYSGELRVLEFSGEEGISQLFGFGIRLDSEDGEIDIDSIVGQPATLTIRHEVGERKVHGIVSRFEQSSEGDRFIPYYAELVPAIWLLTRRSDCQIHQELSVPEIVEKVLTEAGIQDDQFRFALQGTYDQRIFCVQYRESDWNFISRLLEEEGIFYFFEHTDDGCVLVMADSDTASAPIEAPDTVVFRGASGTVAQMEAVYQYRYSQEIRSGKVTYTDFDFEKPTLDLQKENTATRDDALEVYDYPGIYIDPEVGQARVKVGLESLQACRITGMGHSVCRRFIPGFKFTLDEHPRTDFNREYLLVRVGHTGTQPHGGAAVGGTFKYDNEFQCIPSDVPFRPTRKTPKPTVQGTQTAMVTGPSGEEIYPDEYGRVKVQFHWDREGTRDENTSCWIRVSQLWAGVGWGAMWIPRIGQEVIVDFLEGDPDQPIIIGRVYDGDNMPPYGLPDDKTKSTIKSESSIGGGGFNEIRFEDLKGSEEIFLHGQKDWTIVIENDKKQSVGHDETLDVANNRAKTVGNDQSEKIGNNKTIEVGTNHTEKIGSKAEVSIGADNEISVGANRTLTVGKDLSESISANASKSVGKNSELNVGKDLSVMIGKNAVIAIGDKMAVQGGKDLTIDIGKKLSIKVSDEISLKVGSASITMKKSGDITIKGGKISLKGSKDMILKGTKIAEN